MKFRVRRSEDFYVSARELVPPHSDAATAVRDAIESLEGGPAPSDIHELRAPVRHYYWRAVDGFDLRIRYTMEPGSVVVLRVERIDVELRATSAVARRH